MTASITVNSYAKINWTLDVLFRREDGYHEIRTIYQTVSLHDVLRIHRTEGAIEIACNDPRVPCDEANLVHKAAVSLRARAAKPVCARIEIEKRIPVAAGLGGGSSNAAAALLGLVKLWDVGLRPGDLVALAAEVGSDVPFFLMGGTALGVGRGEEVYPLDDIQCDNIVLVSPGFEALTAAAYSGLGRLTRGETNRIMPFTSLAAKGIHQLPLAARNDLEEVVLAAHPEIEEIKLRLTQLGARRAVMSGSGATVYGVFDNQEMSERALAEMRSIGLWCVPVRTVGRREYERVLFW